MTLLQISFWAFAAIAAGGLSMAVLIAARLGVPSLIASGHGLAALAALALLFGANLHGGALTPPLAWWALGVLLSGLIGGLLLFRVLYVRRTPLALIAVHGSIGALGLYLLYGAAYGATATLALSAP